MKLVRKRLFISNKILKRKQLTSTPPFHKAILFSVNASSERCSLNVLLLACELGSE